MKVSKFYFFVLFYSCISGTRLIETEESNALSCRADDSMYTINIKVHAPQIIIDSIFEKYKEWDGDGDEQNSVESYFGSIIDDLNEYLYRFKVQVHLFLNEYTIEKTMGGINVSPYCETDAPIQKKTSDALTFLTSSYPNSVGIHYFLWGCISLENDKAISFVHVNQRCGRCIGSAWLGTDPTKEVMKMAILDALVGPRNSDLGRKMSDHEVSEGLCNYASACVGMTRSEIGQIVEGTVPVRYTDTYADKAHYNMADQDSVSQEDFHSVH